MRLTFESLDGVKADVLPNECGLIQSTEALQKTKEDEHNSTRRGAALGQKK